jgi:DNA-binding beta-propeller fold protein YncE
VALFAMACGNPEAARGVFADGDMSPRLVKIGKKSDGLNGPTDLAFNPEVPGELWVVNKKDDSVSIFFDAGTPEQTSEHIIDPYALHFMDRVTSIDFGAPGTFGSCQDSENTYNGQGPENAFMGPSLWSSDLDVFGTSNPEAMEALSDLYNMPVDLGSHLDMLHESPQCMGIAWEKNNVYWVFDGYHSSINRYDFAEDHGVGWDDHSDGIISRYVEGEVQRKNGTVSHLVLDDVSGLLYIADTGNNRIATLDTNDGREGDRIASQEPGVDHHSMKGVSTVTFIDGLTYGMSAPSGIALVEGTLYVTDSDTGEIFSFDLEGNLLDQAATGLGGLQGIIATSVDELWFVDNNGNSLYRVTPEFPEVDAE